MQISKDEIKKFYTNEYRILESKIIDDMTKELTLFCKRPVRVKHKPGSGIGYDNGGKFEVSIKLSTFSNDVFARIARSFSSEWIGNLQIPVCGYWCRTNTIEEWPHGSNIDENAPYKGCRRDNRKVCRYARESW